MMVNEHTFSATTTWLGNHGTGTSSYRDYGREHTLVSPDHLPIEGSSAALFRGDATRYNPEELLVASLSACHMLQYLHLCATVGIIVSVYVDRASGTLLTTNDGSGHFLRVILRPLVTIRVNDNLAQARELHDTAHHLCFIASSVNFPVLCEPEFLFE